MIPEIETVDELLQYLQELKSSGVPGDTKVTYVDNGDFAEDSPKLYPHYDGRLVVL